MQAVTLKRTLTFCCQNNEQFFVGEEGKTTKEEKEQETEWELLQLFMVWEATCIS